VDAFEIDALAPYRRLMIAVLVQAVYDLHRSRHLSSRCWFSGDAHLTRVEWWFTSRDRRWAFSFENICQLLDLDIDTIRRTLQFGADCTSPQRASREGECGLPRSELQHPVQVR